MTTKIQHIKQLLEEIEVSNNGIGKIGIAISTHNRYDIFKKTYEEMTKFLPSGAVLVVIDDASSTPVPEATFRFNQNVGIARTKNKCFELLYDAGCEHFFLFDDDCYPLVDDWYKPYIESREPHLNYIFVNFKSKPSSLNDTLKIYTDGKINAYSHTRGCMCYFKRICLDKLGGMSLLYGKWGFEHPDLSNRIYNAGLTSFKYMDVVDSDKLIYSRDEHTGNLNSTVEGSERQKWLSINTSIYESRKDSTEYVEFRDKQNIILTSYLTSVVDPQRNTHFKADKNEIQALINSMQGERLVILNDCFENETNGNVQYLKVDASHNPYFQRWVSYYRYLLENRSKINFVFITDATDVEMLYSPFKRMEKGKLYVGDEANNLGYEWMIKNHPHRMIQEFMNNNKDLVLLNAGLIGGDIETVISFLNKFLNFYFQSVSDSHFDKSKPNCGETDMGLFNYIARIYFNDIIVHGTLVNTVFKDNKANGVSWFKHK